MIQCSNCFNILSDTETYCYNCNSYINTESIIEHSYDAIRKYCDSINIKFESFYGVYKVLPDGYKVAILNDLYKTTKTTSKIWEGKEFIIQAFHTGYYERYIIKADTNIKLIVPFFKEKRVYVKIK